MLLMHSFTSKHSGAVINTDVIISKVHSSHDVSLCPGSGVFKNFNICWAPREVLKPSGLGGAWVGLGWASFFIFSQQKARIFFHCVKARIFSFRLCIQIYYYRFLTLMH